MRVAIQTRVADESCYRAIPVLVSDAARPSRQDRPRFLRDYEMVGFRSLDDKRAFKWLLAGALGIPPIQIEGYIQAQVDKEHQSGF